jgi:ABC-type cobalamin/Fe3+-siderophores transport system ATPase subunit
MFLVSIRMDYDIADEIPFKWSRGPQANASEGAVMPPYERGSEWRRWDLHIHAPDTAMANQFGTWDEYIHAISSADPSIVAVGITDYLTIRTYKTFLQHLGLGKLPNLALVLPNIEFRLSPETKKGKGINLHILVCPDDQDHVVRIEEALSRLSLKRAGETISCTEGGLIRLGRQVKSPSLPDGAAFIEGVSQFKVEFDHFRQWYENEEWLVRNSLIALASGSNDGASGLTDGGFLATRREIYSLADIILSGNPSERQTWSGKGGIPASEFKAYRLPKPVIHGSDAHSVDRLFKPDFNRFCWIKADPTFEGLRQIIYEPADRVWIGESPPTTHDSRSTLESISISNANGWFDERELPLNPGLVAIIGLKGSGKTALADLIAFASGASLDPENSFLTRAGDHIDGLTVMLKWRDGSQEGAIVPTGAENPFGLTVKYLSQRFVEQLCTGDALSDELKREVESVIFDHIPIEDRMEAEDFSQLRLMRTQGLIEQRENLRSLITANSHSISVLEHRRGEILKKKTRRGELPKLLESLRKSFPKIDDVAAATKIAELKELRKKRDSLAQSIADLKLSKQRIQDLERRIQAQFRDLGASWAQFEKALRKLGFEDEAIDTLRPVLPLNVEGSSLSRKAGSIFRAKETEIDKAIAKLKLDEAKKQQVLQIQQQERVLAEELRKIEVDFSWLEASYQNERRDIQSERLASYLSYFDLLNEERRVLEELYSPLKTSLFAQGTQQRKLGIVCRVEVNLKDWIARGEELFDLRKSSTFQFDNIRKIAENDLLKAWQKCDLQSISAGLERSVALIKPENLSLVLKPGYKPFHVAEWLFSVDHIGLTHGVQYEGRDLRSLSPGTKGIVLMILYLAVDRLDNRPLIVDQPDENLDNQSTFEILRSYFREAKTRRQIVIITHNPNLVVNTDADQVIVARSETQNNGLPHIWYAAGSLEGLAVIQPATPISIRDEVCRILEGGKEAFEMRERRYDFPVEK